MQLLHAQAAPRPRLLLLSCVLLDAVGAPTAPSGVLARAHSPASALLEALAAVTGVPLDQLAIALPPPAERPTALGARLLRSLSWDDPEAGSARRRSSAGPLLRADGAVVGVRDRNHRPPPQMPDGGGGDRGGDRPLAAASDSRAFRALAAGGDPGRRDGVGGVRIAGFDVAKTPISCVETTL